MILKKILLLTLLLLCVILISIGNITGCAKETKKMIYTGPGMNETLQNGDVLTISLLPYTPKHGDIVAIRLPEYDEPLISRIIAVGGQTIDFDFENWIIYVDGEIIDEPYMLYQPDLPMYKYDIKPDMLPIKIEPGKIFVLGDNRDRALDSRTENIGQINVELIIGNMIDIEYKIDDAVLE